MNTPPSPAREFATEVVARLRTAGFVALWAGGCVRDLLLGHTPSDYDVATEATPEQVMRLFRRTVPVGVSFGVVRVLGPRGVPEVEVATFRSDGAYVDGRRPESVVFGSPEVDASRRDFTINGMFLDPLTGEVIDYVGGRQDLTGRVLRAIGDPAARFTEDKLRLLRAVRFAARFGMIIDPGTREALVAMADQVSLVAAERIAQELRKMLVDRNRARALDLAQETGLLAAIVPPAARLAAGEDWSRTLLVLDNLPEEPGFPLACAALLLAVDPAEADVLTRTLRLANAEREQIVWLIQHQQALKTPQTLRHAELKRLLGAPGVDDLLQLHRAVARATTGDEAPLDYCDWYRREQPAGPLDPPHLIGGADLKALGLKPGPRFKQWLDAIREAQLNGEIQTPAQALEWIARQHS